MTTNRPFAPLALFLVLLSSNAIVAQPYFPDYQPLQPNNIKAWISNEGRAFQQPNDAAGFLFPADSNKAAIFISAPWVAAQFEGDTTFSGFRTAAVQNIGRNGTEYRPGKIRQIGSDSLGVDYNRTRHRLYTLRRGDNRDNSRDFREYPVEDGAPTDVFGNPRILGSETMWSVAHDLNKPRRFSANPLGLELQQQVYGIPSDNPALNNTMFIRNRFINRNIKDSLNPIKGLWKNTCFGIFSDDDLGDPSDDLTGCDTITKTAYTYNGVERDPVYGSPPPAVGHIFLECKRNGQSFDILAYARFYSQAGALGDPESSRPDDLYNFLRGRDKNGNPLPSTEAGSRFMFPGDPETGQGILSSGQLSDVRHVFSAGPVDVPAGDTVEVLYAVTIAVGANRLNSVTRLKAQAAELQMMHRTNMPATKMWLYVNRGSDVSIGRAFPIVVEARDEKGFPRRVSQPTIVSVQLVRGNGKISGNLTGTIIPGQNSVTLEATYQGAEDSLQLQARSLFGQTLTPRSQSFFALSPALRLARRSVVNLRGGARFFPNDTLEIEFACLRSDNSIDNSFHSNLRVRHFGNGKIVGDTAVSIISGVAVVRVAFTESGIHALEAENAQLTSTTDSIRIERGIEAIKYPRFIKSQAGSDLSRLPFFALLRLFGLKPEATYQYRNTMGANASMIVPRELVFGHVSPPLPLASFKTNSRGEYVGWFANEIFGQTSSSQFLMQLQLNAGGTDTTIEMPIGDIAFLGISAPQALRFGQQSDNGTGLIGVLPVAIDTILTRGKIVLLYNTEDSTARPLSSAVVEPEGLSAVNTSKPQFYIDSVESINGRFGTIIPNNLPNGIRRIEIYDLQGRLRASANSPNGIWNGRSSVIPSSGLSPITLVFSGFRVNALTEEPAKSPLPTAFKLGQNYPNPFNPTTTIPIAVPRTERVVLKVFDVLGREVATLVNQTLSQNEYLIPFNASALSSGVYFYRVQAGEFVETKKMILVK